MVSIKHALLLLAATALLATTSCSKDDVPPAPASSAARVSSSPVQTSAYAKTNYGLYDPSQLEPKGRVLFHFQYSGSAAPVRAAYRRYLTAATFDALGGFDRSTMQPNQEEVTGVDNQPGNPITSTSDLRIRLHRDNVFLGEWNLQTGEQIKNPLPN